MTCRCCNNWNSWSFGHPLLHHPEWVQCVLFKPVTLSLRSQQEVRDAISTFVIIKFARRGTTWSVRVCLRRTFWPDLRSRCKLCRNSERGFDFVQDAHFAQGQLGISILNNSFHEIIRINLVENQLFLILKKETALNSTSCRFRIYTNHFHIIIALWDLLNWNFTCYCVMSSAMKSLNQPWKLMIA